MADYILLMRNEDTDFSDYGDEDFTAMMGKFVAWTEQLAAKGKLKEVQRLSMDGAQTLRQRAGTLTLDGPYAEAKELITGYFIVSADTEAEAIEIAATCPALPLGGSVELRQTAPFLSPI